MTLTTRYAFPKLYNLEQQYGGFIKGSIAKAKEPKTGRDRLATKKVFSAQGGLENLIHAFVKNIGKDQLFFLLRIQRSLRRETTENYLPIKGEEKYLFSKKVITTTELITLLLFCLSPQRRVRKDY